MDTNGSFLDTTAIVLIEIDDKDFQIDPQARIEMSRNLVRRFGYDQFIVGRSTAADTNDVRHALAEMEPMTKAQAADVGNPADEGFPAWIGEFGYFTGNTRASQLMRIMIRPVDVDNESGHYGDWTLLAMLFDWKEAYLPNSIMLIGLDTGELNFYQMTRENRDIIWQRWLNDSHADVVSDPMTGNRLVVSPSAAAQRVATHHVSCNCCEDVMVPIGYAIDPETGVKSEWMRYRCNGCGERMHLALNEDGYPFGRWFGRHGDKAIDGPVNLVDHVVDKGPVDRSAEMAPAGDAAGLAQWPVGEVLEKVRNRLMFRLPG